MCVWVDFMKVVLCDVFVYVYDDVCVLLVGKKSYVLGKVGVWVGVVV